MGTWIPLPLGSHTPALRRPALFCVHHSVLPFQRPSQGTDWLETEVSKIVRQHASCSLLDDWLGVFPQKQKGEWHNNSNQKLKPTSLCTTVAQDMLTSFCSTLRSLFNHIHIPTPPRSIPTAPLTPLHVFSFPFLFSFEFLI